MLCAGSVRSKNVMNILIKNVLDACIGCMADFCFGFAISYGTKDSSSFSGEFAGEGFFFLTTTLAAASGGIGSMILNYSLYKVWDLVAVCNGVLAGLVSITAGAYALQPWAAILAGFVGSVV